MLLPIGPDTAFMPKRCNSQHGIYAARAMHYLNHPSPESIGTPSLEQAYVYASLPSLTSRRTNPKQVRFVLRTPIHNPLRFESYHWLYSIQERSDL